MKCPYCKNKTNCAYPCDHNGALVEVCYKCKRDLGLRESTKIKMKRDPSSGAMYPVWRARVKAIID